MNVLILNLTRFGDLLQTQATITDLVRQGHAVGVVCLENFAGAVGLLRGVSHVTTLPGAAFLAALDDEHRAAQAGETQTLLPEGSSQWVNAPMRLMAWRRELELHFCADEICNLTPSLSARLLARFLARQGRVTGFGMDDHGFGYNSSPWAAFLMGAAAARGLSPFNVVDLFRMTGRGVTQGNAASCSAMPSDVLRKEALPHCTAVVPGDALLEPPGELTRTAMRQRLNVEAPEGCAGFVVLQLGASEEQRRWPVAAFAALGDLLWQTRRLCPVLLGTAGERRLAERYGEFAGQSFISLCGETNLEELAAALTESRLLITNDTGTMHLAAGLGIASLSIFLATAQPFDTGPYHAGSYCVEPAMPCHPCAFGERCPREHQCRYAVTPQDMLPLALDLLDGVSQHREGALPLYSESARHPATGGRIWLCTFDEAGFMSLTSLSGHGTEDRTLWFRGQRHILRQFLDRKRMGAFAPTLLSGHLPFSDQGRTEIAADLRESAVLMTLVEQQGKVLLTRPAFREKFMASWDKVYRRLRQSPRLGALAMLWLEETQAEGQDFPVTLAVIGQFIVLMESLEKQILQ